MRNLFLFLIRFNSFFIFLILEVLCLVLVVNNHSYHKSNFINSTNFVSANVYQSYSKLSDYINLRAINDSLLKENASLRDNPGIFYISPGNDIDTCLNNPNVYRYIPSRVINNSTTRAANYLTLNSGKKAGVKKEMGVITSRGIVGVVRNVSDNFASVMSVLNKDLSISIKIKKFNYPGSLRWVGGSPKEAKLNGIPQYLSIAKGDTVVTSGFSMIFPDNILVGTIAGFETSPGNNFYNITLHLSTNFETLQYAYVVDYRLKGEQLKLEQEHD